MVETELESGRIRIISARYAEKIYAVREWQARPLDPVYAVVFMDAIRFHVRSEGSVIKKAVYVAIGLGVAGKKDVKRRFRAA